MKVAMAMLAVALFLSGGCQRRPTDKPEKTVMDLDVAYQGDSSVMVVRPGESVRVGESRDEPKQDAKMMEADMLAKAPSREITYVQRGDSLRLGEAPDRK